MSVSRSRELFERAQRVLPGGVNSPVRACRAVGGDPLFISHGDGAYIFDVDGNRYIDMVSSWGPLILGHAHPEVLDAVQEVMADGTSFGAPTELEVMFAETLTEAFPSMEKVRAVSSGTEATMSALRLARGITGRPFILKMGGGYHGHADSLLVAAGSGAATFGIPGSAGVTPGAAHDTLVVPYNDLGAARWMFAEHGAQIAAVIVEPVAGNVGVLPPADGYLAGLRKLCSEHGALLIFDEVITGFRVLYGGAQALYGVTPDLTCLGKVAGGGLPAAAFGGPAELMDRLAPQGDVYQAGTLSGNPLAMAAGLKTLEILRRPGTYARLEELSVRLEKGLRDVFEQFSVTSKTCINRVGSMMTLFFCAGPVQSYEDAKKADTDRFARTFRAMRERGIFLPPSQFEAMFVSLAHSESEIDEVVARARETLDVSS
ncbi:MAG TPA: glutamate-1-semialdehyde 2,1-aminomutase [Kofleriaceae bacterium]|nr:glutamate-1-semialdehyde 2,1-aminomutase [Kofleriaceae bacterium]